MDYCEQGLVVREAWYELLDRCAEADVDNTTLLAGLIVLMAELLVGQSRSVADSWMRGLPDEVERQRAQVS